MKLSVVIIVCKNDAEGVEKTLRSVAALGADTLLYDTTNKDFSGQAALKYGVRSHRGEWEGYEQVRYKAAQEAKNDWILMLHAGEQLDEKLQNAVKKLDPENENLAYRIRFKTLFEDRWLTYGELGRYSNIRLANRTGLRIRDQRVNDAVFLKEWITIKKIRGYILHTSVRDRNELEQKIYRDALLGAAKYYRQGRKAAAIRLFFSPLATFFQTYFFKLGFLDGRQGYVCARLAAKYSFLKYTRLRKLNQGIRRSP